MDKKKERQLRAEAERKRKQVEHDALTREALKGVRSRDKLTLVAELDAIAEPLGKAEGDYDYLYNVKGIVLEDQKKKLLKAGKATSDAAAKSMAMTSKEYKNVIAAFREAATERARLRVVKERIIAEIGVKRSIEATERELVKMV